MAIKPKRDLYPLKNEGRGGGSQLALECHDQYGHQEAEQRANEVERQCQPLVPRVQRIEASAAECRAGQLSQLRFQSHSPLKQAAGSTCMQRISTSLPSLPCYSKDVDLRLGPVMA